MDRKHKERAARGEDTEDPGADSAWRASYVNWDALLAPDAPPGQTLLALGFPLAELDSELRDSPEGADLQRSLNTAYGGLRTSQDAVARESAADELRELLEVVCQKFPDLTPRCADLQSRMDEVLRRLA
jgi:hypothetical protein